MRPLLFALLLPALASQESDPEKLFRAMEEKILSAKHFQVSGEMNVAGGKRDKSRFNVSILLGQGNRARLATVAEVDGEKRNLLMTSDGTRMRLSGTADKQPSERPTPKYLHRGLALTLARLGLTAGLRPFRLRPSAKPDDPEPDRQITLSDFKMGPAEKVEEREARVIRYKASGPAAPGPVEVTLWLDARTGLPLKRVLSLEKFKARITETYREFHLNPKVNPRVFELSK
jgi:outer membrane lipoprotein-sorting protein